MRQYLWYKRCPFPPVTRHPVTGHPVPVTVTRHPATVIPPVTQPVTQPVTPPCHRHPVTVTQVLCDLGDPCCVSSILLRSLRLKWLTPSALFVWVQCLEVLLWYGSTSTFFSGQVQVAYCIVRIFVTVNCYVNLISVYTSRVFFFYVNG